MAKDEKVKLGDVFGQQLRAVTTTPAPKPTPAEKGGTSADANAKLKNLLSFDLRSHLRAAKEKESAETEAKRIVAEQKELQRRAAEELAREQREAAARVAKEREEQAFVELAADALMAVDDLRVAAREAQRAERHYRRAEEDVRRSEAQLQGGIAQVAKLGAAELEKLVAIQEALPQLHAGLRKSKAGFDSAQRSVTETQASIRMLRSGKVLASLMECANRREAELRALPEASREEVVRRAKELEEVNAAAEELAPEQRQRDVAIRARDFWMRVAETGVLPSKDGKSAPSRNVSTTLRHPGTEMREGRRCRAGAAPVARPRMAAPPGAVLRGRRPEARIAAP